MDVSREGRAKRIDCKIIRLPPEVRQRVDDIIVNREMTFQGISDWLKEQGYDISKSAVGAYAYGIKETAQQVANDLEKTKAVLEYVKRHPDADAGKAAQIVMVSGLMQRVSTAEDEFQEIPLEKAGRLLASLRRVDIAERKLSFEQRKKIDLAFEELESQLMDAIKNDPALSPRLRGLLLEAKERMTADE